MCVSACLAVLLIGAGAYAAWYPGAGERATAGSGQHPPLRPDAVAIDLAKSAARPASSSPVYPYSVIAGGIRGAADLQRAIARDPVVANHFAGFDVSRARMVELARPRPVHVAYRVDGRIYWTSEKLHLPGGERLVTDGTSYARARCGNRVSDVAQAPTSLAEPLPGAFDTPMAEDVEGAVLAAYDLDAAGDPVSGGAAPGLARSPGPSGGGSGLPPPTGWFPPPVGDPGTPVNPPSLWVPAPPTVAVPMPGTLLLLVAGLASYGALCRWRRRARTGGPPPGPDAMSARSPGAARARGGGSEPPG